MFSVQHSHSWMVFQNLQSSDPIAPSPKVEGKRAQCADLCFDCCLCCEHTGTISAHLTLYNMGRFSLVLLLAASWLSSILQLWPRAWLTGTSWRRKMAPETQWRQTCWGQSRGTYWASHSSFTEICCSCIPDRKFVSTLRAYCSHLESHDAFLQYLWATVLNANITFRQPSRRSARNRRLDTLLQIHRLFCSLLGLPFSIAVILVASQLGTLKPTENLQL